MIPTRRTECDLAYSKVLFISAGLASPSKHVVEFRWCSYLLCTGKPVAMQTAFVFVDRAPASFGTEYFTDLCTEAASFKQRRI